MVWADPPKAEAGTASPFHVGEQKVQSLTGARDVSEQLGTLVIKKIEKRENSRHGGLGIPRNNHKPCKK